MSTDALNSTEISIEPAATIAAIKANKPKMVPVKLLRNYRPSGEFEIVGHHRPAVTVRNVAGKDVVITPAEFVKGEVAPPPQAGVGFANKLWAGTVIRIATDEAKTVKANGIGELDFED